VNQRSRDWWDATRLTKRYRELIPDKVKHIERISYSYEDDVDGRAWETTDEE